MQAKRQVPGPHACKPARTACGQPTATARPKSGQPGEGERLIPHAPPEGTRHPSRGSPPATPTTRHASSQERSLCGQCRAAIPAPPAPGEQGQWTPTACPGDGQPGEVERLTPDAPHTGESPPPPRATSRHPHGTQCPAGHASQGASAGSPRLHTRTHSLWAADPDCMPQGRAAGRG